MLATYLSNWQARFTLAQYPNNLAFRKFRLPHPSSPKKWKSLFSTCSPFGGAYASAGLEGLWMGVLVLTLSGTTLLSLQVQGLLQSVGLRNWIATDLDEYVALAIVHCEDFSKLEALRQRLRQQLIEFLICDSKSFAKNLENTLKKMWSADEND